MEEDKLIKRYLYFLVFVSLAIRAVVAGITELGNDELNYWLYAVYPDLSHFDHPPMVGYIINIFTLNLIFQSEFFIRLGAVIIGTINTYIIFKIGEKISDSITGLYAGFLYNASIYCFVIAGIFIMPDTPLLLFWLLTFLLIVESLPKREITNRDRRNILFCGIFVGLAMLSKYTGVFLWIGIILYILIYNRQWLKVKETYIALLLTLLVFSPVIIWNINNDFISFTFQGERVGILQSKVRIDFIGTELLGQFFYNNPMVFILCIISVLYIFRNKELRKNDIIKYILLSSLPIIFIFIIFSLTRQTLPHWSAPGYTGLIVLSAYVIRYKSRNVFLPKSIISALIFLLIILILGILQIKTGLLYSDKVHNNPDNLGRDDFTLDLFGYGQLQREFIEIFKEDRANEKMKENSYIITFRWFPAANYDYYISRFVSCKTYAIGSLDKIRNYYFINKKRGEIPIGSDCYFISSSRDFRNPVELYKDYFEKYSLSDTVRIMRGGKNVMNYFVYRLNNLKMELNR